MDLEEQKFRQKVLGRSLKQWILLYVLRIALNFIVLILMGGSFYLILLVSTKLEDSEVRDKSYDSNN